MGQRLNIEITRGEKVLANAYYHWSGFTYDAIQLTNQIVDYMLEETQKTKEDVPYAIELLEVTGARLTSGEAFVAPKRKDNQSYRLATSRSDGLIGITEEAIEQTRMFEEAKVIIDISDHTVEFFAHFMIDIKEYQDMQKDDSDLLLFDDLPVIPHDIDVGLPLSEFQETAAQLQMELEKGSFAVRIPGNDEFVVTFIA